MNATEQDIIEANLWIARFMGAVPHRGGDAVRFPNSMKNYFPEHLKYRSSWSWLMPVVERMEANGISVKIEKNLVLVHSVNYHWYGGATNDSKIISIWHGVTQFMKHWFQIGAPNPSTCDATGAPSEKIPSAT